jgi:glycosyltransferase involved in cell wall biosynthesis
VIASRRGGIPEIVGDGGILLDPPEPLLEHNWLIPPLSTAIPWVEAIRQLLTDEALYAEYTAAARSQWARHDPTPRVPKIVAELQCLVDRPFLAA